MGTALKENQWEVLDSETETEIDNEKQEIADIREVNDILDKSDLSKTQKIKVLQLVARKEEYSGPIPHPSHLGNYEKILPGSADRILKMAERQSMHRQDNQTKIVDFEIKFRGRGQIFGFILAFAGIIGGFVLVLSDKDVIGLSVLIGSLATLILAFLYGKAVNNNKNSDEND